MSGVLQRFLSYITIDTRSDDNSETTPSTPGQWNLARLLVDELNELGLEQVILTEHCFVHAILPANTSVPVPTIGLVTHLDTSPAFCGGPVNPQIHSRYAGGPILLNPEKRLTLDPELFPKLSKYIGHDIITTDGTSLLGADDKAGIAEVMTALEHLLLNREIPHGEIRVVFTPDEETDRGGIQKMDWALFPVDTAVTVDGDGLGEVNFENFNAAHALVRIAGRSTYTGDAKNSMINACRIAAEWISHLPPSETPENTEGYEGFFHIERSAGTVETAEIYCLIRDFDLDGFMRRKALLQQITRKLNDQYGNNVIALTIHDDYFNMKSAIEPRPQLISGIVDSIHASGIMPRVVPVRGGTDGAHLAAKGIATPNIFVGCHNCHGPYEFISVQVMEAAVTTLISIIRHFAEDTSACES